MLKSLAFPLSLILVSILTFSSVYADVETFENSELMRLLNRRDPESIDENLALIAKAKKEMAEAQRIPLDGCCTYGYRIGTGVAASLLTGAAVAGTVHTGTMVSDKYDENLKKETKDVSARLSAHFEKPESAWAFLFEAVLPNLRRIRAEIKNDFFQKQTFEEELKKVTDTTKQQELTDKIKELEEKLGKAYSLEMKLEKTIKIEPFIGEELYLTAYQLGNMDFDIVREEARLVSIQESLSKLPNTNIAEIRKAKLEEKLAKSSLEFSRKKLSELENNLDKKILESKANLPKEYLPAFEELAHIKSTPIRWNAFKESIAKTTHFTIPVALGVGVAGYLTYELLNRAHTGSGEAMIVSEEEKIQIENKLNSIEKELLELRQN